MFVDLYLGDQKQGSCRLMDAERWRKGNPHIRIRFQTAEEPIMWFNLLPEEEQQFIADGTSFGKNYGAVSMKMIQFGVINQDGTWTAFGKTLSQEVNG